MKATNPTITQPAFFALPSVVAAQEIQKRNQYGSEAHRKAFEAIKAEAVKYGVSKWFGDYED